jgi:hypothetical protein
VRPPVVLEGTAKLCDSTHPMVMFMTWSGDRVGGADPRAPLHIDVCGKLHNRGQQLATVIGVKDARVGDQRLAAQEFSEVTLEPGGKRQKLDLTFDRTDDEELYARAGDTLILKLRLTRGGLRAPRFKLRLEGQAEAAAS